MAGLNLILVTHAEKLLEVECSDVGLPGRLGDLGILPGHTALISILRPGELSYQPAAGGPRPHPAPALGTRASCPHPARERRSGRHSSSCPRSDPRSPTADRSLATLPRSGEVLEWSNRAAC